MVNNKMNMWDVNTSLQNGDIYRLIELFSDVDSKVFL